MASCPGGPERKPKRRFHGPFSGIHTSAYGPENSPVPWPHHLIEIIVTLKSALQGQIPRVEKRIKKSLGPEAVCYRQGSLKTEAGELPFDILCVASDRVYTVKVFPFGLKVTGGANVPQWQFADNREIRKEQNPVPGLRDLKNELNRIFAREGLKNVPVEPLIVFSDNWGNTKFRLEGINYASGYTKLSEYLKNQPKKIAGRIDSRAVSAAIDKYL